MKEDYVKVKFKGGWAFVHKKDSELLAKYPPYVENIEKQIEEKAEKVVKPDVSQSRKRGRKPSK